MSGWVRQAATVDDPHEACSMPGMTRGAALGDLYRCECGILWRRARACDQCEAYGTSHRGSCEVGSMWRPARFWQRVRNRRKGR